MNEDQIETLFVSSEEEGLRLDKILASRYKQIKSRAYFQMLIEQHLVLLNGTPAKKRALVKKEDEIEIQFILTPEIDLSPENIPLDILFEDENLIAINKPSGLVVHPAVGNWSGTFVNALLYHCQHLDKDPSSLRPGIVHRLDKETTGVLIAAKTTIAQQRFIELFSSRKIYKEYLAITIGNPGEIEINFPIGRHPVNRKMMAVVEEGKPAITRCMPIGSKGDLFLVKIELATGRTHQIRVHLKHHKTPILGDSLYGNASLNKKYGVHRQLLHASCLRFKHPFTSHEIEITAPIPEDMAFFVKKMKEI